MGDADIQAEINRLTYKREMLKERIVFFVIGNFAVTLQSVSEELEITLEQAARLIIELEQENKIWSTNRKIWMFGRKPDFLCSSVYRWR